MDRACARHRDIDKGKPGVSRGRKATGLVQPTHPVSRVAETHAVRAAMCAGTQGGLATMYLTRRIVSHSAQAIAEGALISLLVVGLMAGTAFAGKGTGRGPTPAYSGEIRLAPLVVDNNANGTPNRGDVVTFDINTNHTAPYVQLECFQNGSMVLLGRKGYFESSLDTNRNFGLASGSWQSGSADCTASLVYYTRKGWVKYASTSFHADA
jgi:hypothetical protein